MNTHIQQQIQDTIKEIVHIERVEEQLTITKGELDDAMDEQRRLMQQLSKELKDIEKLDGLSTKAIFYKILGSKEKQLEKERQEYLELSLKEEDLEKSIELLEYEVNLLTAKVRSRDELKTKLEKLKLDREAEIISVDPLLRNKLLSLSKKLEDQFKLKTEVEEALEVGQVCHNLMQQVVQLLSRVKNWGQWASQNSNPHRRRRARRDAIDRARNLTYQVKHHLNLLKKELQDLGKEMTFDTDPTQLTEFSDFFFGNLITDWIMQQQLVTAINSANKLYLHLNNVVLHLIAMRDDCAAKIQRYQDDRDKILIS